MPELRAILNQQIPQAAEAIRRLTGSISIRQEAIPGKKHGARWFASFSPDLLALSRHVTQGKDCPDSITLEFLCHGNWIMPRTVTVSVENVPKYEQLAPKFKEMRESGRSVQEIAFRHKIAWQVAWEVIQFAETGERPTWQLPESSPNYAGWEHFAEVAPLIADLRDRNGKNWQKIVFDVARKTGHRISIATAVRAYEHAHRLEFRVESGISTEFRPRSGKEKMAEFQKLFDSGITNGAELARRVGISRNSANRWKKRFANGPTGS